MLINSVKNCILITYDTDNNRTFRASRLARIPFLGIIHFAFCEALLNNKEMKNLIRYILFVAFIFSMLLLNGCDNDIVGNKTEITQTDNVIKFYGKVIVYQDGQIVYNNTCNLEPPAFYFTYIPQGNYLFNIQYNWTVETENQFIIAFNNDAIFIPCNQNYQYLYNKKIRIDSLTEFTYGIF